MAEDQEVKELVQALWKQGFKEEARSLVKIATGMNKESQELQMHFFEKALSNRGVDLSTLELDPVRKIMSFEVNGLNFTTIGPFIEKVLRSINRVGNSSYELEKVRRGNNTVVEIKIGS